MHRDMYIYCVIVCVSALGESRTMFLSSSSLCFVEMCAAASEQASAHRIIGDILALASTFVVVVADDAHGRQQL